MADVFGEINPERASTGESGKTGESTPLIGRGDVAHVGPGPEVMGAGTLIGDDVINPLGEDLGTIKEIMLDVSSGRVAYAVLSSGGLFGVGDKLYAIPWSALTLDADRKCLVLDVSKEQMEAAPGFDKDNWPPMADPTWATELHNFYRQRVYWRAAVAESGETSESGFTEGRSSATQVFGA